MRLKNNGFTLIELMIVVAIIGILAAIAIPKFAELIRKSNEGASKGSLGSLRSAVNIYYAEMEGQFPGELDSVTISGRYLSTLPAAKTPYYHADNTQINLRLSPECLSCPPVPLTGRDRGGWAYTSQEGIAAINCYHTDTKGTLWSFY